MTPAAFVRLVLGLQVACLLLPCAARTASARPKAPRTVLAIHWGPADYPSAPTVNEAIRDALSKDAGPTDYFAEYLESDRIAPADAEQALADSIRRKYRNRHIDVVLAIADPALRFVLDHRGDLFADTPIVFSGVAVPDAATRAAGAGLTAVMRAAAYGETLKLALDLRPSTEHVFVIAKGRDAPTIESVYGVLRPFSKRVKITYLEDDTTSGLLTAVTRLPPRSLILFIWYTPGDPGFIPDSEEVARLIVQVSPVPVFGTNERYVGAGIVGGVVRGRRETGARMGEMALQILNGRRAQDIPIEDARLVASVDWRQVMRWGIDASLLPAGSNILFKTPTAWETYRSYVLATIAIFGAQLALIAALLTQRARRRRAEETIRTRETALRISYERIRHLAGRLINAQEAARAGIARDLHDDVCQRLVEMSLAVTSLRGSSAEVQDAATQEALTALERHTQTTLEAIRRLSHDLHPATLRLLGLAPALRAHCIEVAKQHDVHVGFNADANLPRLDTDVAVCLFRIAQESLRNGLAHGDARRFDVSLARSGDHVELTVADDGRGFDVKAARQDGSGLGLVSIEERVHAIGGDVRIVSGQPRGTTIHVRAPLTPPWSP